MPEIFDIVQSEGINLINNVRANLGSTGTNATLRTSRSLRIEVKQEGTKVKLQLIGRPFFMSVETGRRPTPGKKPSREFIENLKPWMEERGIDLSQVWAIANTINRKGTRLWLDGGRADIVTSAIDEYTNNVALAILDNAATEFQIKIRTMQW